MLSATSVPSTSLACPLCSALDHRRRIALEGYTVLECRGCDFVFTDFPASRVPELYDQEYFEAEFGPYFAASFGGDDSPVLRAHFEHYAEVMERFQKSGRVLDAGCAGGLFLDVLAQRGWRAEGVELSPFAARVARERCSVPVHEGDLLAVDLEPGSYDVVSMLDVLEHLPDPRAYLRRTRELLRPGGLVFLVLPNDRNLTRIVAMLANRATLGKYTYPASRVHQIYHLSYFTPETARRLVSEEGFEVLDLLPDETVQDLLNEPLHVRLAVRALFGLSRILHLENKMIVVGRCNPE